MLNENQVPAANWILQNVLEQRQQYMTLIGQGGSGKTFLIMDVVAKLQDAGLKVVFAAPTNKAVKQLEKSAREYGLSMDNVAFMTAHAALGLAILPNEDRKSSIRVGPGVVGIFDVMVLDEASMLSKIALFKYMVPDCDAGKTALVGMGDDLQLPPVRESVSAIFTEFPVWRLEGNERQKPGPLREFNVNLRQAMLDDRPFKGPDADGEQVVEVPDAKFLKTICEFFTLDTDLDNHRVLAWSNARVNQINKALRAKLYGPDADYYMQGERVVTGGPIKGPENEVLLGTDEECLVHHANENSSLTDDESGETYRTIQLVLNPIHVDRQVIAEVLHPDEHERYVEKLRELKQEAIDEPRNARPLWVRYHQFMDLFADIRYCRCITVHRSQGSTYDTVFLDMKDILKNKNRTERRRLVYVGASRPRNRLTINKRNYIV